MLRVVIVDDESLARQGLKELLAAQEGIELVGEADSMKLAREVIRSLQPDAVFLDIKLPDASGFDLLESVEHHPKVVFVTAYSEFALDAFNVDAVDYLLKPVRPDRLSEALLRLRVACGKASESESDPLYRKNDRICFRTPGRTVMSALTNVCALQADGDFTRVFFVNEPSIMICHSLGAYEQTLPNPPFLRVDRSLIVNVDQITRIEHPTRDVTRIHLGAIHQHFSVGRKAWSRLRAAGVSG